MSDDAQTLLTAMLFCLVIATVVARHVFVG